MDFTVNKIFVGKSVDEFLSYYHVAKATKYKLETNKLLTVNDKKINLQYIIKKGDVITIALNQIETNKIVPFQKEIDIIYEDNDILIVNKPDFLLVHTDGNTLDTLSNRVSYYAINNNYEGPIKHVHRIDYETSGMVIFAKHFIAHSYLSFLFEKRQITKTYVCMCHNKFNKITGVIDTKIGKDRHENKQRVSKTGKDAITKFKVVVNDIISKVEVEILDGRKHQVRVHMASISHPIVGDKLYGRSDNERLLLHFKNVNFIHPSSLKAVMFNCNEAF